MSGWIGGGVWDVGCVREGGCGSKLIEHSITFYDKTKVKS